MLRESQLLSLEDVQSQRALLESQVGQRKDLEDSLFEAGSCSYFFHWFVEMERSIYGSQGDVCIYIYVYICITHIKYIYIYGTPPKKKVYLFHGQRGYHIYIYKNMRYWSSKKTIL